MKALLLAAGFGTRLRPLTNTIPKCLVPINGKPLMEYWLEMIVGADIESILVNSHYLPEKVQAFVSQSEYSAYVKTVYEEKLLGTGGTVLHNKDFFKGDQILLVHADNLSVFNIKEFIRAHYSRPAACDITMMTFNTSTPQSCGIVELDSRNVVTGFYEKVSDPPGNLANGAVFILENSVIRFLEQIQKETIDFCADVLPFFLGKIFTFHNDQYHRDIGTMESYQQAIRDFKNE